MKMRNIYIFIVIIVLVVKCNSPEHFDRVEHLKQCLIDYGFHPDTTFNTHLEYSWKIKICKDDSLLCREAAFYLFDDTAEHSHADYRPKQGCFLLLQEYQYLSNKKNEYVIANFPSVYEDEKKKILLLEHIYNSLKGLRHNNTPEHLEFQKKVVLTNRYVQLVISIERENVNDTTNARELLNIIENGISQLNGKKAQKKYMLMKKNPLLQNNLLLERKMKDSATPAETNKPPMEEEAEEMKRLERIFSNRDITFHCIDICRSEDGCIDGGYISITVQTSSGLPVDSAECSLLTPNKYRYNNKTDKFGRARWCRVKKDQYTIELIFKGKKYMLTPIWDSLPCMELITLK